MNSQGQFEKKDHKKFKFVIFFGIFGPLIYFLADLYKFPLITYFPATGEFFLGWRSFSEESGPAMYWYGWILASAILSSIFSIFFTYWVSLRTKYLVFLSNLIWISIFCILPFLIHSLKFYWK